jgi:hypothetical protein
MVVTDTYLVKRTEMLQEELESLKKTVLKKGTKKPAQMRGIWKDINFPDKEIEKAKSLWLKE